MLLMTDRGPVLDPAWGCELLRTVRSGDSVVLEMNARSETVVVESAEVPGILCDWAGGYMKS